MSVEHEFSVSTGCHTTQSLQTTMPFTDALVDELRLFLPCLNNRSFQYVN